MIKQQLALRFIHLSNLTVLQIFYVLSFAVICPPCSYTTYDRSFSVGFLVWFMEWL